MPHPKDVPLDKWTDGWLVLEVASLLDDPLYIMMHEHEREAKAYPVTRAEMIGFIRSAQG